MVEKISAYDERGKNILEEVIELTVSNCWVLIHVLNLIQAQRTKKQFIQSKVYPN